MPIENENNAIQRAFPKVTETVVFAANSHRAAMLKHKENRQAAPDDL
jgi:hypothetical protein